MRLWLEQNLRRVGLVGGELGGLAALIVALEGVANGLDVAVRVGARVDGCNITVVGVNTSKELAVLRNDIADSYGALVLAEKNLI